ncbi:MAG: hypothetical protein ACXAC2_23925, partial [Candidatus Kariarchaeaceae archaeon]
WLFSEKTLTKIKNSIPLEIIPKLGNTVYSKDEETHKIPIDEIINLLSKFTAKNIVITGGEPLLQKSKIVELLSHLKIQSYRFEIETNGTLEPINKKLLPENIELKYNVSPKLSNSYNSEEKRINLEILNLFKLENSIFKFVITENLDIEEVNILVRALDFPSDRVYLMPEAQTKEELAIRGKRISELAVENNYNYSHRLHIEIYGDQRGV